MNKDEYKLKYGMWGEIYTHITPDGSNLTIGINPLRELIRSSKLSAELIIVDEAHAKRIIESGSADPTKVAQLAELMLKSHHPPEPIIHCIRTDGTGMLVDGHHRYILSWLMKMKHIASFVCYPAMWEPFIIVDLEPLTKEQLRASPHPSQVSPWKMDPK